MSDSSLDVDDYPVRRLVSNALLLRGLNHPYAYVDNNPIIKIDPDGQIPLDDYTPIPVICRLFEETATECFYECPKGRVLPVPKTSCRPTCKRRIVVWWLLQDLYP